MFLGLFFLDACPLIVITRVCNPHIHTTIRRWTGRGTLSVITYCYNTHCYNTCIHKHAYVTREYARLRLARVCYVGATCSIRRFRTAQAFTSSHSALDDHCVFSVPALHAGLRAESGPVAPGPLNLPSRGGLCLVALISSKLSCA